MLARLAVFGLLAVLTGCSSPWTRSLERAHIYHPAPYPQGDWNPQGIGYEDALFQADDGTHLHGWYLPHPQPQAVVLFAHGNAGNVTSHLSVARELYEQHGVSILLFDYRGYGRSEGTPDEAGLLQDARAARSWLARRAGVDEREIVLVGQSLGGAVAVDLAAGDGAPGLVLISTFTSLPDLARHHVPLLASSVRMTNEFDSLSKIGRYSGPLLQSHGDEDEIVPYEFALDLFGAARGTKQFVTVRGGRHNDPLGGEFHRAFDEFLGTLRGAQQN